MRIFSLASLAVFLFCFTFVAAQGLLLPNQFYGDAIYNNVPANGIVVDVYIDGINVGSTNTVNGTYGGESNLLLIKDSDGSNFGKTVNFFLNGVDTGQTAIYDNGAIVKIDLIASGSVPVVDSPPAKTGGGGGGSGGSLPPVVNDSENTESAMNAISSSDDEGVVAVVVDSNDGQDQEEEMVGFFSAITGAATGVVGSTAGIIVIVFILLIALGLILVKVKKR